MFISIKIVSLTFLRVKNALKRGNLYGKGMASASK